VPVTVKVNGVANSLVHKGSNGISIATIPDVCKTPSPGGPVPIPYPNISQSVTLGKGTTTVKADRMMVAIKGSEFSLSNGDNAGVAGGVKSSTFMKESTWILYSFDVKMDGKNACRLTDKKFQNHENTVDLGGTINPPVVPGVVELRCEDGWTDCQKKQMKAKAEHMDKQAKATPGGLSTRPTSQLSKLKSGWQRKYARDWNNPNPKGWWPKQSPANQPSQFYDDCAKTDDPLAAGMEADHMQEVQLGGNVMGPFRWLDGEVNGASGRQIRSARAKGITHITGVTTANCD
jgi:hypothetical protein